MKGRMVVLAPGQEGLAAKIRDREGCGTGIDHTSRRCNGKPGLNHGAEETCPDCRTKPAWDPMTEGRRAGRRHMNGPAAAFRNSSADPVTAVWPNTQAVRAESPDTVSAGGSGPELGRGRLRRDGEAGDAEHPVIVFTKGGGLCK